MNNKKALGEWSATAHWAGVVVGGLLFFHVVRGKKWEEVHTLLGATATGLFIASKL